MKKITKNELVLTVPLSNNNIKLLTGNPPILFSVSSVVFSIMGSSAKPNSTFCDDFAIVRSLFRYTPYRKQKSTFYSQSVVKWTADGADADRYRCSSFDDNKYYLLSKSTA